MFQVHESKKEMTAANFINSAMGKLEDAKIQLTHAIIKAATTFDERDAMLAQGALNVIEELQKRVRLAQNEAARELIERN